jgi:UDP:flavonoid glycosyltransferase YjiC (YdhE family)
MALVVAAAWGTLGDVLPFVAVGAELVKRGHDVTFVSNPVFEPLARKAGVSFAPVGTEREYRDFVEDPGLWDRETLVRSLVKHFLPTTQAYYEAVTRVHRPGETLLFAPEGFPVVSISREKLGLPFAGGVIAPSRMGSRRDPAHPSRSLPAGLEWIARSRQGLRLLHWLKAQRSRWLGAGAKTAISGSGRAVLEEMMRVRTLAGLPALPTAPSPPPALSICFWPSWFSPPQPDWPANARVVGFPFFPRPAVWSGDHARLPDAPIVFTRGSSASHQGAFFSVAVECCRLLGRPGVLVTPQVADVPAALPDEVRHVAFADFGDLFPAAAAVVHHGGIGTIAHALAAGVPQVAVPIVGEQFDLAYRVARLGVGTMLTQTPLTAARLARAVASLLRSERTRARCESLRDRVDTGASASLGADRLHELLMQHCRGEPRVTAGSRSAVCSKDDVSGRPSSSCGPPRS